MKLVKLKALLKLCLDDSMYVREHSILVVKDSMPKICGDLCKLWSSLDPFLQEILLPTYQEHMTNELFQSWSQVMVSPEHEKLERGLSLLNDFPHLPVATDFNFELNQIAGDFIKTGRPLQSLELVDFLFGSGNFSAHLGSLAFETPIQHQFQTLLQTRKGTSFSLSCLLILVGARLGMQMGFCNFGDRILVKIPSKGSGLFVDPANHGELMGLERLKFLSRQSVNPELAVLSIQRLLSSCEILNYVLKSWNTQAHEVGDYQLGKTLFDLIESCKIQIQLGDYKETPMRLFQTGEVVRHSEFNYCGIVVDWDAQFQREKFQLGESTPSHKKQEPWYKILVEDGKRIAYVPQSNLLPELSDFKVEHPLLPYFFEHCPERGYVRNGRLWPELY